MNWEGQPTLRFVWRRLPFHPQPVTVLQQAIKIDGSPGYKWVDVPTIDEEQE